MYGCCLNKCLGPLLSLSIATIATPDLLSNDCSLLVLPLSRRRSLVDSAACRSYSTISLIASVGITSSIEILQNTSFDLTKTDRAELSDILDNPRPPPEALDLFKRLNI